MQEQPKSGRTFPDNTFDCLQRVKVRLFAHLKPTHCRLRAHAHVMFHFCHSQHNNKTVFSQTRRASFSKAFLASYIETKFSEFLLLCSTLSCSLHNILDGHHISQFSFTIYHHIFMKIGVNFK